MGRKIYLVEVGKHVINGKWFGMRGAGRISCSNTDITYNTKASRTN